MKPSSSIYIVCLYFQCLHKDPSFWRHLFCPHHVHVSYGLICVYITKYLSHLFSLKPYILFVINLNCHQLTFKPSKYLLPVVLRQFQEHEPIRLVITTEVEFLFINTIAWLPIISSLIWFWKINLASLIHKIYKYWLLFMVF